MTESKTDIREATADALERIKKQGQSMSLAIFVLNCAEANNSIDMA
jgi:hypothetical protein